MGYLDYFEKTAKKRVNQRRKHSYYWDDITKYVDYFSNDNLTVLEIGSGTGELIASVKARKKVGIDFSPSMVEIAKAQYPEVEFHLMKAEEIELTEKFDLIILSNLIGFTSDVQRVFEELKKVSHSRTKIIVTYYNHFWEPLLKFSEFIGIKDKTPTQNWLSISDVRNLLHLADYNVYRESRRMIIPFNIPIISFLFNRILGNLPIVKHLCINNFSFACQPQESEPKEYSVSIVIPARNESGNIESGLLRIPKFGKSQEIIFIEGNSTDDTWETIQQVKNKYQHIDIKIAQQSGKGKYNAVQKGFEIASGEVLMILDADLTVPPEELPKFYRALSESKADFINGCRLVYPMEKEAMRFLNMLGNKFFGLVFSWLLDKPFKDTLCGTKVIFKKDYQNLSANRKYFGDFDPFGDFDLIFGAHKLNLRIIDLPIRYKERTYGTTNISRFKHGLILLRMCVFAAKKIKFV